eukprot:CAMPEP_0119472322 /NCGR_PEP_ID=MMETSP1344-20130328/4431_1 /TAXON_ID=236787 /ORGANISM="Florenciella parvula, Strain CCMP2471" /LENGTH=77 /DNA_ID=CAMNT_0007505247 /DNA_START=262 /DNA_END=491 /DNA_ORIENTATION=-
MNRRSNPDPHPDPHPDPGLDPDPNPRAASMRRGVYWRPGCMVQLLSSTCAMHPDPTGFSVTAVSFLRQSAPRFATMA